MLTEQEETPSVSLLEWATAYLEYSEKTFSSEKTFWEKKVAFRELFKSVDPDTNVELLKPAQVLSHLQQQKEARSGSNANRQRKNLLAAWNWGKQFYNLPESNPIALVPRFAEKRSERRVPALEDFWKVYEVAQPGQDQLMLLMYLQTGARREELFRLTWKDVDFEGKQIRIYWRKNKIAQWNSAWLPVKDEIITGLRAQQRDTGFFRFVFLNQNEPDPQDWVPFMYRNKWLPKLCEIAGVEPFGVHGIRHLFASILAEQNVPLVEIQRMLRHGSIGTTQRYIHSLKKENREVLKSLPGLSTSLKAPYEAPKEAKGF